MLYTGLFLDGQVAGGHCTEDLQCNAEDGLECVPEKSVCKCSHGSADIYGHCFENPINGNL